MNSLSHTRPSVAWLDDRFQGWAQNFIQGIYYYGVCRRRGVCKRSRKQYCAPWLITHRLPGIFYEEVGAVIFRRWLAPRPDYVGDTTRKLTLFDTISLFVPPVIVFWVLMLKYI